ncbi:MAG: phosphonate metabolism transcriptional regulator PhnF [Rhizobiaceae bacterium]|nr:phosphonate metabolism transcriptional regulator PhnF [Rhizobiaceae bacterium]MCV0405978.1 phosphonate metabolism transcriptional regulator PhnF [Rhizobiaceae bacterium]
MVKAAANPVVIDRRGGVALWRQIADRLRGEVAAGAFSEGDRLPPEFALAGRFGVNRHTLRAAIAALVDEGVLRAEQGRGTFVARRRRLSYPIAARTRFSEGLAGQARERSGRLIEGAEEPASRDVAAALDVGDGDIVTRLETVSEADGRAVSRATSWFPARLKGIERHYARSGSVTRALNALGVTDYVRRSTTITARHADPADLADLGLAPGAILLVAVATSVDGDGRPVQHQVTRFAADRVEFSIEHS